MKLTFSRERALEISRLIRSLGLAASHWIPEPCRCFQNAASANPSGAMRVGCLQVGAMRSCVLAESIIRGSSYWHMSNVAVTGGRASRKGGSASRQGMNESIGGFWSGLQDDEQLNFGCAAREHLVLARDVVKKRKREELHVGREGDFW